jgi:hypothetical protein
MRTGPASISRYDVCKLACETYTLALSTVNLQSAFRKTDIHPVDIYVIIGFSVLPAEVFQSSIANEGDNTNSRGGFRGGRTPPPPKIGKNMIFLA